MSLQRHLAYASSTTTMHRHADLANAFAAFVLVTRSHAAVATFPFPRYVQQHALCCSSYSAPDWAAQYSDERVYLKNFLDSTLANPWMDPTRFEFSSSDMQSLFQACFFAGGGNPTPQKNLHLPPSLPNCVL